MAAEATPSPTNTPAHLISSHSQLAAERPQSNPLDRETCYCNRTRRTRRRGRRRPGLLKSWEMETVVGDLMATELRLGLPGTVDEMKATVPSAPSTPRGKKRTTTDAVEGAAAAEEASCKRDVEAAPPAAK